MKEREKKLARKKKIKSYVMINIPEVTSNTEKRKSLLKGPNNNIILNEEETFTYI